MNRSLTVALAALAFGVASSGCSDDHDHSDSGMDAHDHDAHVHCRGFMVGADGTAMLSGIEDATHDGGAHEDPDAGPGAMCVTLGADPSNGSGATMDGVYSVDARSLRGALTADAPDNEGFSLTVRRMGSPLAGLTPRLFARMPHHDHMVPGGHGPANDFNVMGFAATATGAAYVVDPVDFNMAGPWLFEVRFSDAGAERRVYFSMEVTTGGQ